MNKKMNFYSKQEIKELKKISALSDKQERTDYLDAFSVKYKREVGAVYQKMWSLKDKKSIKEDKTKDVVSISKRNITIPFKSLQIIDSNLIIKY